MITLYVKDGCPYCAAVIHKVDELGLQVDKKNIKDEAVAEELIQEGGKRQVPYIKDSEKDIAMYESSDIVEYLEREYGNSKDSV